MESATGGQWLGGWNNGFRVPEKRAAAARCVWWCVVWVWGRSGWLLGDRESADAGNAGGLCQGVVAGRYGLLQA